MPARSYYARKLFELSGLLPIGAFLVDHLYSNFQVVGPGGRERFDKVVVDLQTNPAIVFAEIFAIALPLLYHAGYGLLVLRIARPNAGEYGTLRNWTYVLQRVTGLLLLAFIGYHVWNTRVYPILHPEDATLQHLSSGEALISAEHMHRYLNETMANVPLLWVYVVALACATFHLGNGLWNLGVHWGVLVSRKAQRQAGWACLGVGAALFSLGVESLLAFVRLS